MLGRVFEGVMAPEARHASGTFYTPAALVGRVLDAALVALIAESAEVRRWARRSDACGAGDPDAARVLAAITLLDPAVGSGAFLLGALDRLPAVGSHGDTLSARKRRVLQQNLFGVDLSAAAVRLTELRLWLAVIADDPARARPECRAAAESRLPHSPGDSLFDPIGQGIDAVRQEPEIVAELSGYAGVITASGAEKQSLIRRLRTVEARALGASLTATESAGPRATSPAACRQARGRDLFGQSTGAGP